MCSESINIKNVFDIYSLTVHRYIHIEINKRTATILIHVRHAYKSNTMLFKTAFK